MGCVQQMLLAEGAAGNTYATWNPLDKSTNITLSNGDLTASQTAVGSVRSTISKTSGKWYWEVTVVTVSGNYPAIGIGNSSAPLTYSPGDNTNSVAIQRNGNITYNGSSIGNVSSLVAGVVIGFAVDVTNRTLDIYKNGALIFNVNLLSVPTGAIFAMTGASAATVSVTANFGASAFTYSPPSGYNSGLYQ